MTWIEPLYLPEVHDGMRFWQGVFYADNEGLSHYLECPTSDSLMQALATHAVYKIRLVSIDERVWEFEVVEGAVFAGCYQQETYDKEGDYDELETENGEV